MTTIDSAKATWASCGVPATTSPTAQTPSALVRMVASATTNPRSSIVTPASGATRPSVRGRRPTETTTASTASFPSSPKATTVPRPDGSGVCPCSVTPALTSIPRFLNERATVRTTSSSQPLRIVGRASKIVTEVPRSANIEANSQPIAPPPITATEAGQVVEGQHLVRGHHDRAVDVETRDRARHRAGRQHDVGAGHLDGRAVVPGDAHPVVGQQGAAPVEDRHPTTLEQAGQPGEELTDDLLLALLADRELDRRVRLVRARPRCRSRRPTARSGRRRRSRGTPWPARIPGAGRCRPPCPVPPGPPTVRRPPRRARPRSRRVLLRR